MSIHTKPIEFSGEHLFPIPLVSIKGGCWHLPPGCATIYPVHGPDFVVRAFLHCDGDTYRVHPLDVLNENGEVVPLPCVDGLVPSSNPDFLWELPSSRRLMTVPMARWELALWAESTIGH